MKLTDGIAHVNAAEYADLKDRNQILVDAYGNKGFLLRGYFYKLKLVEKINDN